MFNRNGAIVTTVATESKMQTLAARTEPRGHWLLRKGGLLRRDPTANRRRFYIDLVPSRHRRTPDPAARRSAGSGCRATEPERRGGTRAQELSSDKESRARAQAAEEGIGVARTAYLPRLDLLWQENRATTNNVFGLLLPQSVIPSDLGARARHTVARRQCLGECRGCSAVVGSGRLRAAKSRRRCRARADDAREEAGDADRARCGGAAADAFLTVLAADEGVRAARANVDRLQVFATPCGRWYRTSFDRVPISRGPRPSWLSRRTNLVRPSRSRTSRGRRWPKPSARQAQSLESALAISSRRSPRSRLSRRSEITSGGAAGRGGHRRRSCTRTYAGSRVLPAHHAAVRVRRTRDRR